MHALPEPTPVNPRRTVHIYGVPMDLGQERRGVDMGPSALRYAGLQGRLQRLGYEVVDAGNLEVLAPEQESREEALILIEGTKVRHLQAVRTACEAVYATADTSALRVSFCPVARDVERRAGRCCAGACHTFT